MSKKSKKLDSKALAQQKRSRRRALTYVRMLRYGVNNFSRNAWLTIAATAVMTITLLIIFTTIVGRHMLTVTVDSFRERVDMSIYVEEDTPEEEVRAVGAQIEALESVKGVSYETPDDRREQFIESNKTDSSSLNSLNNSDPEFPWTIRANLIDINDTAELQTFVDENPELAEIIDSSVPPSFSGPLRKAIEQIGGWINFADKAGLVASIVFVVISSLIVFNTIRMAIFNRREEIQMMKLIGADKSFIRGPFIVEAVVYGFIAALVATGLGMTGLFVAREPLASAGIQISSIIDTMVFYSPFILVAMIILGALIGVVSSYLATRRYLKI